MDVDTVNRHLSPFNMFLRDIVTLSNGEKWAGLLCWLPAGDDSSEIQISIVQETKQKVFIFLMQQGESELMKLFDAVGSSVFPYLSGKMFLKNESRTYTIKGYRVEAVQTQQGKDDKLVFLFEEESKPFIVSNKTNTGRLFELWGDELDDYKGKKICLVMKEEKHGPEIHKCLRVDVNATKKANREAAKAKPAKKKSAFLTWWESLNENQQTAGKGKLVLSLENHPRYSGDVVPIDDINVAIKGGIEAVPTVKGGRDEVNIRTCVDIHNICVAYADLRHAGKDRFEATASLQDAGSFTDLNEKHIAPVSSDFDTIPSASAGTQPTLIESDANNNAQLM